MTKPLPFFVAATDPPAKQKILIASLHLFTHKGLCETSIRDIGDMAGYTNPALYRHFKGKDELAQKLFQRCIHSLFARLETAVREGKDAPQRLRALVATSAELYDQCPEAVVYVDEMRRRTFQQLDAPTQQLTMLSLAREVVGGDTRGERGKRVDVAAMAIVGTLNQVQRMLFLGRLQAPATRWVDDVTRTLLPLIDV